MFQQAYVKRRCIIPAWGFCEWTVRRRAPHFFSAADGDLLAFAGIGESWRSPEGEKIITCTIITRDANPWMAAYHNRMPAMLDPKDFDNWLHGPGGKELLMMPPRELREWIVSARMNKTGVGDDDPATIEPFEETLL